MQKFITVSVDDGYPKDLTTAELLIKYDLKATFYVSIKNPEREVLRERDLIEISQHFEIGGHTFSHKPLIGIPKKIVENEVIEGKKSLEQMIGKQVFSFCYPKGKFNKMVAGIIKDAGFIGARTCMYFLNDFPKNPFSWGISSHANNHSKLNQVRHAIVEKNICGLINFFRIQKGCVNWVDQFKFAVDYVEKHGGIAHLYMHSWEIDENDQWTALENLLRFLSKKELTPVTNGELFTLYYTRIGS